jgi:hypothetical protein
MGLTGPIVADPVGCFGPVVNRPAAGITLQPVGVGKLLQRVAA